jgi:hypothetical protein
VYRPLLDQLGGAHLEGGGEHEEAVPCKRCTDSR